MTEQEIVAKVRIDGVSSVKELKDEIKDLRDKLVRLDDTSEDYKKTVDELIADEKKLTEVMRAGKNEVSAATGSYNALQQEMTALKKVWKEVTSEAERARIGKRIAEINVELKQMDATIGNFQRNVGDYENAFKKALMTPQQELKKLRNELAQLTEGTEEYNRVFVRMADLTTKITKQQELLRYSSADLGNILSNLAGTAAGVVGGFSAINAAMGLMGEQDEDVQQAMLKVQQFMALVQGLSALEGLKDKIQGLWTGISNFIKGFRGGTAAVTDFEKSVKEAEGTTEKVTSEMSTQATTVQSNAAATNELKTANDNLKTSYDNLRISVSEINAEYAREADAVNASSMSEEEKIKRLERLKRARDEARHAANQQFEAENKMKAAEAAVALAGKNVEVQTVKTNNVLKLLGQSFKGAGTASKTAAGGMVIYTAATKAAEVATQALKVALMSLGIGIIIAGLTALLGLLGKVLKPLWDMITGTKAAKEATDALKTSTEQLNQALEQNSETMDYQSRLMAAQGKDYEEIYQYKKQSITADLNLAKAHLAEAEAQAAAIGQKKLAKKKYDDFREGLEELRNTVQSLTKDLTKLDQERTIYYAQEETNKRNRGGGGGGGSKYDQELKAAENLYKKLMEWYKTDRQKLKETYEANKESLKKYIKDKGQLNAALLALDQQYYADLKKLHKDNMEAIYNIYMGQERRRLALMNVWGDKYLERAIAVLDEEQKVDIAYAAKRVGFEEKTAEQIAQMDAATKKEYLEKQKLFNNEKWLIEQEYAVKERQLREEHNTRLIEEGRREIEIKRENAKTDEELHEAEIELAEYDLANVFQKEGESANQYQLRVIALVKALEELQKKRTETGGDADWTQLRLNNDAEAARINNGDQSMQYLNARLKAAQYYYDNLKQLDGESLEEFRQRNLEALSNLKDAEQAILQQRFDNWSNLANGIGDIMGSIADMYMTDIQAQKDADGQYNAESKRKFEFVKRLQIAQATIQTISGAIAAFMGCQSLGQPWGAVLGAVQAAAVTAAGVAQIMQIKKQTLDGGGNVESVRYATATPSITDYVPEGSVNLTGGNETENLANALAKNPIKAYVVESEVTASQELAQRRISESTF